jgi:pimeloyl-ACP methyl ester carboxylesterase
MRIARMIHPILSAGVLLTAGFHSVGYAQPSASSQDSSSYGVKNIVLVHGAWADGSSWSRVIPLLEAQGYHVVAAQLPLTSLEDDDAAAERAIARITAAYPGPVLLVGHSYGGVVIGDKPGNDPNVAGLVYVAAFAPDSGESALSLLGTLRTRLRSTSFSYSTPRSSLQPSLQKVSRQPSLKTCRNLNRSH